MKYLSEGCILQAPPLTAVLGSMWHVCHGRYITHLLLAVPFPQALPCCSYFMAAPAQHNQKSRCETCVLLPWHTYRKPSNAAVLSHCLGRQLLPLWLPCVMLWISKWNYPSDILRFTNNTISFPVETCDVFRHAGNDYLWWNCGLRKIYFRASKINVNRWLCFSFQSLES